MTPTESLLGLADARLVMHRSPGGTWVRAVSEFDPGAP